MTQDPHEIVEVIVHTPVKAEVVCSCGKTLTALRIGAEEAARGLHRIHVAVERARAHQKHEPPVEL